MQVSERHEYRQI